MIVADSSFIMEALLNDKDLIEREDTIIAPDLAPYEVANSIWKHQFLFKDIKDGSKYISLLSDLVDSESIVLVRPDSKLFKRAFEIAGKNRITIYDAVFLALAIETGLELKSLDTRMIELFKKQ